MGGANDSMDSRSCLHAIETTLKTGIIYASVHGNAGCSQKENLDHLSPVINLESPLTPRENFQFPAEVMEILKQDITGIPVTMRRATLSLIAGFLVRIASERNACVECMITLSTPKSPATHLQLIRSQDLGGLKYPSDDFLNTVDIAARFICSAVNYSTKQGVRASLLNVLLPFFQEKLACSCDNSNVIKIITEKFISLMLDNITRTLTITKATKGINFQCKPLQRKILKL